MRNLSADDDEYDYSPNELAELSIRHRDKYEKIVQSNLDAGDSVDKWEQHNLEYMQKHLKSLQ